MKITKDEAAILAWALDHAKYELAEKIGNHNDQLSNFNKLDNFGEKLWDYSKDKRRQGRTSQNDFSDILKRFHKTK